MFKPLASLAFVIELPLMGNANQKLTKPYTLKWLVMILQLDLRFPWVINFLMDVESSFYMHYSFDCLTFHPKNNKLST
jgi:hypothetical protein